MFLFFFWFRPRGFFFQESLNFGPFFFNIRLIENNWRYFSKGSCVAAATLEIISQRGALGIFATHFHEVDGMNLNFDRVRRKKMEIALDENDRQRPTWRMCDGISRDSLALEVRLELIKLSFLPLEL